MKTTAESIAAAIIEQHPHEAERAADLALEIAHCAAVKGYTPDAAIVFLGERPRNELSGPAFLRWCVKNKIVPLYQLEAAVQCKVIPFPAAEQGTEERESSQ